MLYMVSGKCDLVSIKHACSYTKKLRTDLQESLGYPAFKQERRNQQLKNDMKPSGRLSHDCSETCRVAHVWLDSTDSLVPVKSTFQVSTPHRSPWCTLNFKTIKTAGWKVEQQ